MMKDGWIFRRGDLYIADLGNPEGSEQGGVRPVVILQNDVGNLHSPTITIAPLTSKTEKKKHQPTHYYIRDKKRILRDLGKVSKGQMRGIDEAVKEQLKHYIPERIERGRSYGRDAR